MDWIDRIRAEEKAYQEALRATPLNAGSEAMKMARMYFGTARQEGILNMQPTLRTMFQDTYKIAALQHVEDILSGKEGMPTVSTVGDLITELKNFASEFTKDLPENFPHPDSTAYRFESSKQAVLAHLPKAEADKICQKCNDYIIQQIDKALASRREVGS